MFRFGMEGDASRFLFTVQAWRTLPTSHTFPPCSARRLTHRQATLVGATMLRRRGGSNVGNSGTAHYRRDCRSGCNVLFKTRVAGCYKAPTPARKKRECDASPHSRSESNYPRVSATSPSEGSVLRVFTGHSFRPSGSSSSGCSCTL
jgi:hypothetical protein